MCHWWWSLLVHLNHDIIDITLIVIIAIVLLIIIGKLVISEIIGTSSLITIIARNVHNWNNFWNECFFYQHRDSNRVPAWQQWHPSEFTENFWKNEIFKWCYCTMSTINDLIVVNNDLIIVNNDLIVVTNDSWSALLQSFFLSKWQQIMQKMSLNQQD